MTAPLEPPAPPEADPADTRLADLAAHPRIADPETRDEYLRAAIDLVGAIGLDVDSFVSTAGASEFRALDQVADWKAKAERFDAALAQGAEPIRAAAARTARPNAAGADHAAARRGTQDAARRLQRSGSVNDAAAALAALL